MNKLDENKVKELFKKNGYVMLEEYKRYCNPILCEKDGYKFKISYGHLLEGNKPNLFGGRNEFQKENISIFIKRKNKDIELLDVKNVKKSGKHRIIVTMKCSCGEIFSTTWDKVKNNEYLLCNFCSRKIISSKRKKRYNDKHIKNIEKKGYKILNKDQDIYALERIEVEEISTGFRGFLQPSKNSKKILIFSLEKNRKYYLYNINLVIKNQEYNTKAIDIVDNDTKILAKCECGNTYKADLRSFYRGNCVCQNCSKKMSNNERLVKNFLEENSIDFIQEFIINSCRDLYPLPFDFYLKKENCLLEIDGEQHEKPIAFDGNFEQAELRFKLQQKHDQIKNEYCKKYNIPLLRISYKDIKDESYRDKIIKFIQTVQD